MPLLNEGASIILNGSIRATDGREDFGLYAASKLSAVVADVFLSGRCGWGRAELGWAVHGGS